MIDHLWQSTIFAFVVWLVALALRGNRAGVRYWVWLGASLKFLVPFSWLVGAGELAPKHAVMTPIVQTEWVVTIENAGRPLATAPIQVVHRNHSPSHLLDLPALVWMVWAGGFAVMLISFGRKWRRMHANVKAAKPLALGLPISVRSSVELFEPGVFGIVRPVLLVPQGIEQRLSPAQWNAIVAHELCHVTRRDNLTATIHMAVQAIFWFHPVLWWIGTKLIDERERACDEEVLRLGNTPRDYAEGIVNVCKLYTESPMACVAGVTGSDLKKRIEAIMKNRTIRKLTAARKILLAGAALAAAGIPVTIGFMHAPAAHAQSSSAEVPKWEVASIRRCEAPPPNPGGRGGPGGAGSGGAGPGRYSLRCGKVEQLIHEAYIMFPDGRGLNPHVFYGTLTGGPAWIRSELYDVEAKPEGTPSREMMSGPMMQALLEDRFKLKIHREVRQVPVYELVIAKGGPKMPKVDEATCPKLTREERIALLQAGKPLNECGSQMWTFPRGQSLMTENDHGVTVDQFASGLTRVLDRAVIDKTGLTGLFDFHVEFSPDQTTPAFLPGGVIKGTLPPPDQPPVVPIAQDPTGPSYVTAIQEQLGLKLQPAKGPGDFLVIDSIERPSEN
jgi:bla regulator protein blaR1